MYLTSPTFPNTLFEISRKNSNNESNTHKKTKE